jgi:hypothetical protein
VDPEVASEAEAHVGVAAPGPGQQGGTVVLQVPGPEQHHGNGHDVRRPPGHQGVDRVVDVGLGQLEVAGADGGAGQQGGGELDQPFELGGGGGVAAAVADDQERRAG